MDRRAFLRSCAAVGAAAAFGGRVFADDMSAATLTLASRSRGVAIPSDFLGFSYETGLMPSFEFLNANNSSLLALYSLLGRNGVIRIGGNSSEYGIWRPNGDPTPIPKHHIITPDVIKRVAGFVHATGWRCIYGLNLGTGNPTDAADEAAAAAEALGDSLIAFQIGNEPDLFSKNGLRPKTSGVADYLAEWKTFADAVKIRVPSAQFAGPDTASSLAWVDAMASADGAELSLLSNHYYSEGPGSSPKTTIDKMMRSSGRMDSMLRRMSAAARSIHKPFRITEMNSVYGGGRVGVSDTQSAAVWGIDVMMRIANAGGLGVNFHGGSGGAYSPVHVTEGLAGPTSVFYAFLMFSQIGIGEIVPVTLENQPVGLAAYAIRGPQGKLSFVVINSSITLPASLNVDSIRPYQNSEVWRLSAPAFDQAGNTYFGGASIQPDNQWNAVTREGVIYNGSVFNLILPVASAALIKLS